MNTKNRISETASRALIYILLSILAFSCIVPFYWMLIMGTLKNGSIYSSFPIFPADQLLENYKLILHFIPFWTSTTNSLVIAVFATLVTLFFSPLAGYVFAKHEFVGREKLFIIVMATMMIPYQLTLVGLVQEMKFFRLLDSFLPLIIPAAADAFGIFLTRQYISEVVHNDLIDSARIDGCGEFRIFLQIVYPIITPVIASLAILSFMGSWNNFIGPLVLLYSPEKMTLTLTILGIKGQYLGNYPVLMLASFLAMLPILVAYLSLSKYFIAGLTSGAIKG